MTGVQKDAGYLERPICLNCEQTITSTANRVASKASDSLLGSRLAVRAGRGGMYGVLVEHNDSLARVARALFVVNRVWIGRR